MSFSTLRAFSSEWDLTDCQVKAFRSFVWNSIIFFTYNLSHNTMEYYSKIHKSSIETGCNTPKRWSVFFSIPSSPSIFPSSIEVIECVQFYNSFEKKKIGKNGITRKVFRWFLSAWNIGVRHEMSLFAGCKFHIKDNLTWIVEFLFFSALNRSLPDSVFRNAEWNKSKLSRRISR